MADLKLQFLDEGKALLQVGPVFVALSAEQLEQLKRQLAAGPQPLLSLVPSTESRAPSSPPPSSSSAPPSATMVPISRPMYETYWSQGPLPTSDVPLPALRPGGMRTTLPGRWCPACREPRHNPSCTICHGPTTPAPELANIELQRNPALSGRVLRLLGLKKKDNEP